jgi:hypothetical protein
MRRRNPKQLSSGGTVHLSLGVRLYGRRGAGSPTYSTMRQGGGELARKRAARSRSCVHGIALFENSLSTNAPHTQSSLPAKEPAKGYGPHPEEHREAMRLEGWPQPVDSPPSFETRAPDSASALPGGRAPPDEAGDLFHYHESGRSRTEAGAGMAGLRTLCRFASCHPP